MLSLCRFLIPFIFAVTVEAAIYYVNGSSPDYMYCSGTVQTTYSDTQLVLDPTTDVTGTEPGDGDFTDYGIYITGGTNAGYQRRITGYTAATKTVTWASALPAALDGTSTYLITVGYDYNDGTVATKYNGSNGAWASPMRANAFLTTGSHTVITTGATYPMVPIASNYWVISQANEDLIFFCTTEAIITSANTTATALVSSAATNSTFSFTNFTFTSSVAQSVGPFRVTSPSATLSFTTCDFTPVSSSTRAFTMEAVASSSRSLTMTNCTINGSTGFNPVFLSDVAKIVIDGGTFTATDVAGVNYGIYIEPSLSRTECLLATIKNVNFVNRGLSIQYDYDDIWIDNNTITNSGTQAKKLLEVGVDGNTNSYPVGRAIVTNNTVTQDGTGQSHSILIGTGADGAYVANNTVTGGDWAFVIKGSKNLVTHNKCDKPILIKGGVNNFITYNTVLGYLFLSNADSHATPARNVAVNNIFDDAIGYRWVSGLTAQSQIYTDYNCILGGSNTIAVQNVTPVATTISNLRSAWATAGNWSDGANYFTNDSNSIEADPKVKADYTLQRSSPATGMGAVPSGTSSQFWLFR